MSQAGYQAIKPGEDPAESPLPNLSMQEYDTILKRVLTRSTPAASLRIIGFEARRWLNVELPPLRSLRVDLPGEDPAGRLFHVELQSANDPAMARRMLQVCGGDPRTVRTPARAP